jgi:hypothetical protein
MRNDSRPIFEHSPASPIGGDERPIPSERPDSRDTIAHGRQSHTIHEQSEANGPVGPDDPVTPSSDAPPTTGSPAPRRERQV